MRAPFLSFGLAALVVATTGCGDSERKIAPAPDGGPTEPPEEPPVYTEHDLHPEPPAILRDVALVNDDVEFTRPFVPGHRTTMDGRVAIRVQGGPPGTQRIAENLSFFLMTPERLSEPVMVGPPGVQIQAETAPFDVPFPPALDAAVARLGHHAICDPTEEFAVPSEKTNPYPCGPNTANDCYDITIISSTSPGLGSQLWGTPATVEISAPKTAGARIAGVQLGDAVAGHFIPLTNEWTEPAVTTDGRLLTGRLGRAPRDWTNPNTGETTSRFWDLAYAVLPQTSAPCDVTGWTDFHPMSHAPFDPQMVGRYGLAAYPFRDSEGELIPDGEDLGGTYPWVDREGANVFMSGVPGRMIEQSESRFPRRCVTPGCEDFSENTDWDRGFLVGGLWTHGKFVHLDAMINNMDWAVGVTPAAHYMVDLYRDDNGDAVEIRFGGGRFIDAVRDAGGPFPPGFTHNANILDSLQNLPNHTAAARTITPRDVVWLMSTGVATDEVAFDDFLDPNAFIVSNMQGSITQLYSDSGESLSFPHYWNGQVRTLTIPLPIPSLLVLEPELDEEVHVQNAATSLEWKVPPFGRVEAATGRIEPVALGGVQGKGFWLSGESEIRYTVPAQARDVADHDWYVGLFIDPRDDERRVVAKFPDGSAIRTGGRNLVQYVVGDRVVHRVTLPDGDKWVHLAWRLSAESREVTLLHDGFAFDRYSSDVPLFQLVEGDLVIGQATEDEGGYRGYRGWIDDFKVFAYAPNPEVACNHAHGTIVEVVSEPALETAAALYPEWAHAEVASASGAGPSARFACYHDYSGDYAAHLGNIPTGAVSARERITFPEGPLRAGTPRPDSSGNRFCLSCHTDQGRGGLTLAALELDAGTSAENDRRRQPLQPPRRVFGNIPPGWIPSGPGPGSPGSALQAPAGGLLVDEWLLPGPGQP